MKGISRHMVIIVVSGLIIISCRPSKICPAYHSSFILDPAVTKTTFSLFAADSLPRDPRNDLWQIDKKKVGIADDMAYRKKVRQQSIISMESIYLKQEDPFEQQLAMAEMDSSMRDSLRHVQRQQYDDFYNYDQMIYLHYFGDYLPKGKPEADISDDLKPEEDALIKDEETDGVVEEKKGFFNKIFGKKKEKEKEEVPVEEEEENLIDESVFDDL